MAAPVSLHDRLNQIDDGDGCESLLAAIAQEHATGEVLMLAWMNREAIDETLKTGKAVYWSRSRSCLWRKGETSGNTQDVVEMRLDCDYDAILLRVVQRGPACHLAKRSCFFRLVGAEGQLVDDPFA